MFVLVVAVGLIGLAVEYTKPGTDTGLISEIMKYIFLIGTSGAATTAISDGIREFRNPGSARNDTAGAPKNTQPHEQPEHSGIPGPKPGIGWGKDG
jgi:hypothetical protein